MRCALCCSVSGRTICVPRKIRLLSSDTVSSSLTLAKLLTVVVSRSYIFSASWRRSVRMNSATTCSVLSLRVARFTSSRIMALGTASDAMKLTYSSAIFYLCSRQWVARHVVSRIVLAWAVLNLATVRLKA